MNVVPWVKNMRKALLLNPLVVMHGNVRDQFYLEPQKQTRLPAELSGTKYIDFPAWLAMDLEQQGYDLVVLYDSVDEAVVLRRDMLKKFTDAAGGATPAPPASGSHSSTPRRGPSLPSASAAPVSSDDTSGANASSNSDWMVKVKVGLNPENFLMALNGKIFRNQKLSTAVIFRFTDRYLSFTDRQDAAEKRFSILLQKTAMSIPANRHPDQLQSRIVMLFDLEGAVPQELGVQAPFAGTARIPSPSQEDRELFFQANSDLFYSEPGKRFDAESDPVQLTSLASLADGLKTQDLISLSVLSHDEQLGLNKDQFKTLLDRFRFGTRENAWLKIKNETLAGAADFLKNRVKGQDAVIADVVPTLIRAKLGLTEISNKGTSTKPRGVFFFVGPTGVGKTELTKAIAELIFGDEASMARFDMSEYSEEHQQARLVGAPPGYVGFDQGGQLPNAILEQPFSVVLFDEVEKAHGRILDKFLQILDDGRLTDGMGRTVYFSEAIIIFTSNIGTSPRFRSGGSGGANTVAVPGQPPANATQQYEQLQDLSYEDLQRHFRDDVKDFFVNHLGRPEILNRIGEDNILVFNFLSNEGVKDQIIQKQVKDLADYLSSKFQVSVDLTPSFCDVLKQHPNGFKRNGARGVRNLLRKLVLDKVAMDIFARGDELTGHRLVVDYAAKRHSITEDFRFDATKVRHDWRLT
ncbi:AAA family ATPase [Rhodopirellula europaea]|jgi:DNA polymerase III delta prime subunit|uniref:ATP-dependent Clp protease regulatory subunit n=1 Tax=Rhodopirellula europaea SH398 TaxID=1263868 RepID=M5RZF9_9BACT|nr:AAA family ATPase [Rhodopirellula europaea]EMI24606.1 ATP-dependent Clp protease regulatory subunit [Rhodopirellula europaea SH398]